MNGRKLARRAGFGVLFTLAAAGYVAASIKGGPYAAAAVKPAEPGRIVLVRAETGLALDRIEWSSAGRASAELAMTGDGAGELGKVGVTVHRSNGAIVSLKLAGNVTVSKSWTFSHGHWNGS